MAKYRLKSFGSYKKKTGKKKRLNRRRKTRYRKAHGKGYAMIKSLFKKLKRQRFSRSIRRGKVRGGTINRINKVPYYRRYRDPYRTPTSGRMRTLARMFT